MPDLASVAERLRVVRSAQRRFMRLWQLHEIRELLVGPAVLDRVAADVDTLDAGGEGDSFGSGDGWNPHPDPLHCPRPPSPPAPRGR